MLKTRSVWSGGTGGNKIDVQQNSENIAETPCKIHLPNDCFGTLLKTRVGDETQRLLHCAWFCRRKDASMIDKETSWLTTCSKYPERETPPVNAAERKRDKERGCSSLILMDPSQNAFHSTRTTALHLIFRNSMWFRLRSETFNLNLLTSNYYSKTKQTAP